MKTRIITGLLLISAIFGIFYSKNETIINLFFVTVGFLAFSEVVSFKIKKDNILNKIIVFLFTMILVYLLFINESWVSEAFMWYSIPFLAFAIFYVYASQKRGQEVFEIATLPFVLFLSLAILGLIYLVKQSLELYQLTLFSLLLIVFADSFAYFSGRLFGKNKFVSYVSPNKTIEGVFGGFASQIILILVIYITGNSFVLFSSEGNFLIEAIILSLSVTILSILGDLFISSLKRKQGIKDTGKILPGHGGVLDRLDSIFITLPFVYLIQHLI